ncbi:outer membrane lipoprotein carrier protein [Alcanivorax hongdengensis A-11-3]|uniref:Outer-membrane lipoprotein carrier protein n=1 Tax=Alcanivorax hongdengensis A-11-3 TaxID=1177179 RepID=L0WCZ7_9GAMM|nr:outer membrane lipoprotein carrier protein [Alcanivorax hongdengensis A-11-3]
MLLVPTLVWAGPTEELLGHLQSLKTLSGQFDQTILDASGTHLQEAHGNFQVARGNRFYWHTQDPFEQIAVSNGSKVWVYDVDLEQVVERPLSADLSKTPALLFGGQPDAVGKAFRIAEKDHDGQTVTYRLTPKGDDPLFEQLDVTFQGNQPQSMRLKDALGQQTVIDFPQAKVNGKLDDSLFDFQPPEGADVIQQQSP